MNNYRKMKKIQVKAYRRKNGTMVESYTSHILTKKRRIMLTKEEHIKKHIALHRFLDELLADFIIHTSTSTPLSKVKPLSKVSVLDFVQWSHKQTINPDEKEQ